MEIDQVDASAATNGLRPCFIVSTGRAGSMMLARVLAVHPQLMAFHEPLPRLNTIAYLKWAGRRDSPGVHGRLATRRDLLIEQVRLNHSIYVESSHWLSHLIPELYERYDARFIHLYRDGRSFTRSGLSRGWYSPRGFKAELRTLLRRWREYPTGDDYIDYELRPPRDLTDRFEKVTWLWTEINRSILDGLATVPDAPVFEVRLETFDRFVLEDLLEFLGVEPNEQLLDRMLRVSTVRPNRTRKHDFPRPEQWADCQTERFWTLAGEMMTRLGYEAGPKDRRNDLDGSATVASGVRVAG